MSIYLNVDELFTRAQVTLDMARQTPEILARLSIYGYDEAHLQQGLTLLETARSLHATQKRQYGEQYAATEALMQAWRTADERYLAHRRLARLALRQDPQRQHALGLDQPKKGSFSGWLGQALVFYTNTLGDPEVINALARFNVTQADLEQGQALVQQVADLNSVQEREKYEAQAATRERDAALDALGVWLAELREVARIALADVPQQLEALQFGVVA
jgi:hypothetical protein